MYNVSEEFHTACKSLQRAITCKVVFNGSTELTSSEIQEIAITEQFGSSDGITFGATFSSQCKLTIYKQTLPLNGAYFVPYVGVSVNGEIQYIPKGKYYIPSDGVEDNGGLWLTITGYDRMAALTDDYIPNIDFPTSPSEMLADVCKQANIAEPAITFPEITISELYSGSIRQQLGWLAGLVGCNAKFNSDGDLVFCWYTDSITVGLDEQYQSGLKKTADDLFAIQAIITGTEESPITVGTGVSVSATNPYMTEAAAESVFEQIKGTSAMPCNVKWRGNPAVESGDILHIVDAEDSDGGTFPVLVMEQALRVKGGMSSTTTCYGMQDKQYTVESPITQQIKREYTGLAKAMQEATERIIGAKGGYWEVTYDDAGYPTGWMIRDTPTLEDNTRLWVMNVNGLGYSKDGGKTISGVALTMDGQINANAITTGQMSAEHITVNGQTLSDFIDIGMDENGHPVLRIGSSASEIVLKEYNDKIGFYDATGNLLAYWNSNSFELVELSRFRLGPMNIIVQPNKSVSFVGVT